MLSAVYPQLPINVMLPAPCGGTQAAREAPPMKRMERPRRSMLLGVLGLLLVPLLVVTHRTTAHAQGTALTVPMVDFAFGLPSRLPPGTYTWNVPNQGQQPHVLILLELKAGKTLQDLLQVLNTPAPTEGPPPGLAAVANEYVDAFAEPGKRASVTLTLHPGNFVAICPVPDPSSGKPHFALGMISELRVREGATTMPSALPNTGTGYTSVGLWLAGIAISGLIGGWYIRRKVHS